VVTLAALGAIIVAAGVGLVSRTTERMLREDARLEVANWSAHLVRNVPDFAAILAGNPPSSEALAHFELSRELGRVYQFKIYDRDGKLHVRSDQLGMANTYSANLFQQNRDAAGRLSRGETLVRVGKEIRAGEARHFAEAIVPIVAAGRPIGYLQVLLSQDQRRALLLSAATEGAITVGLLLALGPVWGFWYRTRQKRTMERKLDYISTHDPLTGLMNRAAWLTHFSEAAGRLSPDQPVLTVLAIELSGIRLANESLGNAAGDHILKVSAERLAEAAGPGSFLSRIGSNQFGVIAAPFADPIAVAALAHDVVKCLSQPVQFGESRLNVTVTIGVALTPIDGTDQMQLVKAAEIAATTAHAAGRNTYRFFDAQVEKDSERKRSLERFAATAIEHEALDLHYQPIIGLKDGRIKGFEALLRVTHPELGPLSPAEFVAAAERSGDIDRIGAWSLEQACRIASQWPDTLTLAVNLSPAQFNSGKLVASLRRAIEITRFPAYRLELEITEGIMMGDAEFIHTQLHTLQEMGVRVALDDFGTGYSSLSYLWKFPFSRIKIDQSFVRQIGESHTAEGIISTIISLGRSIGVPLTAEGIETAGQLAYLRHARCEDGQGYLFSRPVPATELAALILRDFSSLLPGRRRKTEVHPHKTGAAA
jgi:diguanylate cyclase (GGDEF)-like protein